MFTNPAAGVIATSPATAPEAMPSTVGFSVCTHSMNIQASAAAAAEVLVDEKGAPASPSAASAVPALNPNHPNHSRAAPSAVSAMLEGNIAPCRSRCVCRAPSASTSAATPAFTCTTVPPAKSRAPICAIQPLPHTQWAIGQ